MHMETEFTCPECETDFEADWSFGDDVTCPHCGTVWETDYDESWDGIMGPWITGEANWDEAAGA